MKLNTIYPLLLIAVTGLLLSGCGSSSSDDSNTPYTDASDSGISDSSGNTNPVVSPDGTIIPDGARLLASQCFQCHGTDGRSQTDIDSLAGESERELIEEMLEMRRDNDNDLMTYQAHGYSDAQIRAIAAYIAAVSGSTGGGSDDDD
jgi:cytochrome c553